MIDEAFVKRTLDGNHQIYMQVQVDGITYDIWRVLINPGIYMWSEVPPKDYRNVER